MPANKPKNGRGQNHNNNNTNERGRGRKKSTNQNQEPTLRFNGYQHYKDYFSSLVDLEAKIGKEQTKSTFENNVHVTWIYKEENDDSSIFDSDSEYELKNPVQNF